jgi:hypothetical protein
MYGMRNSTSLGNEDSEEKIEDFLFLVVVSTRASSLSWLSRFDLAELNGM